MGKSYKNKEMMSAEESVEITTSELSFFFPRHSVTIKAASREEAEKKLKVLISNKK